MEYHHWLNYWRPGMAKAPKPFWFRNGWYTESGGQGRVLLAKGKENYAEAVAALHRLLAERCEQRSADPDNPGIGVTQLADLLLDELELGSPETYSYYTVCLKR